MKNKKMVLIFTMILCMLLSACTGATKERAQKDKQSNKEGGLWRNAIHYDINGKIISQVWGKFDLEITSPPTKIKFDHGDERHIWVITSGDFESNEVGEAAVRTYWRENDIPVPGYAREE